MKFSPSSGAAAPAISPAAAFSVHFTVGRQFLSGWRESLLGSAAPAASAGQQRHRVDPTRCTQRGGAHAGQRRVMPSEACTPRERAHAQPERMRRRKRIFFTGGKLRPRCFCPGASSRPVGSPSPPVPEVTAGSERNTHISSHLGICSGEKLLCLNVSPASLHLQGAHFVHLSSGCLFRVYTARIVPHSDCTSPFNHRTLRKKSKKS